MARRKCTFNAELEKEFPFIKKMKTETDVRCTKCEGTFSIANSGRSAIKQHLQSSKHKKSHIAAASSKTLTSIFRPLVFDENLKKLACKEGTWAYHCIQHSHSFRSSDCTSKLIKKCFDVQYSCARTKTEAIILNVFTPFIVTSTKADIAKVNYLTIYSDCSNHGNLKMCAILVRYFLPTEGVIVKILNIKELPAEDSNTIKSALDKSLEYYEGQNKLIALCADNTNCNFGGAKRKGQNNVFYKMQEASGNKLIAVNCSCHICNNCINVGVECLSVDIEVIVVKIYSYFYIYTIRNEKFKEICNNIDVEYEKLLGHSKTRWLTLMPALQRIIKLFKPLKVYFLQQEKCPTLLKYFFEDPLSEIWLRFVCCQAENFHKHILKMESQHISMCEAARTLSDLKLNLIEKKEHGFLPLDVNDLLSKLDPSEFDMTKFLNSVSSFYETCISYLNLWDSSFEEIRILDWVLLNEPPVWENVVKCISFIKEKRNLEIKDNDLFDEFVCLKNYISIEKISFWKEKKLLNYQKWVEVFEHFNKYEIYFQNILKIVEFSLCLPGSNAPTERVFSIVNNMWTSEKTQLKIETLEAAIFTKCNLNLTCTEFFDFLKDKPDLLKKISSSQKYV